MHRIRIWDLPTRLFHWALVACVLGLVITGNLGGNWMNWHLRLGYVVLTLLLFRLVWGFAGGHWSRFRSFLYGPKALLDHLRGAGRPEHKAGHTPLGALSVFLLLSALLIQVTTGLFSDDEIAFYGPLMPLVSGDMVALATSYHTQVGKLIVLALVVLHLLALAFYKLFKKEALVAAMVHGDKCLATPVTPSQDNARNRLLALLVLGCCAATVYGLVTVV